MLNVLMVKTAVQLLKVVSLAVLPSVSILPLSILIIGLSLLRLYLSNMPAFTFDKVLKIIQTILTILQFALGVLTGEKPKDEEE